MRGKLVEFGGRRAADLVVSGSLAGEKSWSGGLNFFGPFMASCGRSFWAPNSSGSKRRGEYLSRHRHIYSVLKNDDTRMLVCLFRIRSSFTYIDYFTALLMSF